MTALINKVIGCWRGSDGRTAEVVHEGGDGGGPERWSPVDSLPAPTVRLSTVLELSDGTRTVLATNEVAHILPDRAGVLVVFVSSKAPPRELISFSPPHNAAIFNADGSLRFQLKNPCGDEGVFRAVVSISLPDGRVALGVRACPQSYPLCETVYIVDGSTDDLSKQLPRWVRD